MPLHKGPLLSLLVTQVKAPQLPEYTNIFESHPVAAHKSAPYLLPFPTTVYQTPGSDKVAVPHVGMVMVSVAALVVVPTAVPGTLTVAAFTQSSLGAGGNGLLLPL